MIGGSEKVGNLEATIGRNFEVDSSIETVLRSRNDWKAMKTLVGKISGTKEEERRALNEIGDFRNKNLIVKFTRRWKIGEPFNDCILFVVVVSYQSEVGK